MAEDGGGESGQQPRGLKLRPPERSEGAASWQTSTISNLERAHRLRLTPFPLFFFTLNFHFHHGYDRLSPPMRPFWQEGDAYVDVFACHLLASELTRARFLQEF